MVKKVGRPTAKGTAVGIKPYLSDRAIAWLNKHPSRSSAVASLIEKAATIESAKDLIFLYRLFGFL